MNKILLASLKTHSAKNRDSSQKGFTLVELLIVIVIIGILAAVVIGVISPVQQQARALDGTLRAQIDKLALSNKSLYVSSPRITDRSPTLAEFGGSVSSSPDVATNCISNSVVATESCIFSVNALALPQNCSANLYNGVGTSPCNYIYWRDGNEFKIGVRGAAKPFVMFVYSYEEDPISLAVQEGFYSCPETFNITSAGTPAGCTRL